MATKQRLTTELARMAMLYRQQMSAEEIQAMAEIWAELCGSLSDELFIAACKAAMRESAYFPSPAIILRHAEIIREMRLEEQRRAMRALPYDEGPYTDADIDRIAGHCQRILESLEKRMRARQ